MPVFQTFDPLSAASDAVGSYYDAKRKRELELQALSYQQQRDARKDMESDRTFGLEQGRAADEHTAAIDTHSLLPGQLQAQGDAHTDSVQTQQLNKIKIAAAQNDENYNQQIRPLLLQEQRLKNKFSNGEILSQADAHAVAQITKQIKTVEAQHAQTKALLDEAQSRASIAATNASANASNASAYREMHPIAPRQSAGERELDAFNTASSSLSPQGGQFLDMIYGTNNPPTRMQALQALAQSRLGGGDKKNLRTIIESRESQFETPGQQYGQDYRQGRDAINDSRYSTNQEYRRGEQLYHDVARGKAYNALSPRLKSLVHSALVGQNMSVDEAIQALQASGLPDNDKQAIAQALGATQ